MMFCKDLSPQVFTTTNGQWSVAICEHCGKAQSGVDVAFALKQLERHHEQAIEIREQDRDCIMTWEHFVQSVEDGALIDYDGHGYPSDGKVMWSAPLSPSDLFLWKDCPPTHIVWFNR